MAYEEPKEVSKPVPPPAPIPTSTIYDLKRKPAATVSKPGEGYVGSGTDKKNFAM